MHTVAQDARVSLETIYNIMWIHQDKKESISSKSDMILEMIWRAITDPEINRESVLGYRPPFIINSNHTR